MLSSRYLACCALFAIAAIGCDVPRDADGTLERVTHGTLRVGVVRNGPWVVDSGGTLGGVEPEIVTALARELGARVEWVRRPEPELMHALHDRQLDLVVGGLTADLPWKGQVAFTRPYYTDSIVVGIREGTVMREVRGQTIAIEDGDAIATEIRRRNGLPVVAPDLSGAPGAVAASVWQLAALGRVDSGILLREEPHVVAVAPGENGWLVRVERTLRERRASVPRMLRASHP